MASISTSARERLESGMDGSFAAAEARAASDDKRTVSFPPWGAGEPLYMGMILFLGFWDLGAQILLFLRRGGEECFYFSEQVGEVEWFQAKVVGALLHGGARRV